MISKHIEILIRKSVFSDSLNFLKVKKSGSHIFEQMVKKHPTYCKSQKFVVVGM